MSFRGNEVTVGIQRSEMRLRLDCHVATFVAPRNDDMVRHPHPNSKKYRIRLRLPQLLIINS